ncbi:MAG: hypothetical protein QW303_02805 [Nitrososphaerota archaeon]
MEDNKAVIVNTSFPRYIEDACITKIAVGLKEDGGFYAWVYDKNTPERLTKVVQEKFPMAPKWANNVLYIDLNTLNARLIYRGQ